MNASGAQAQAPDIPLEESGAGWRYESIDMDIVLAPEDRSMTVTGVARLRLAIDESFGPTFMLRKNNGDDEKSEIVFASIEADTWSYAAANSALAPGWHAAQVSTTFPALMVDAGSALGSTKCAVWQLTHVAA